MSSAVCVLVVIRGDMSIKQSDAQAFAHGKNTYWPSCLGGLARGLLSVRVSAFAAFVFISPAYAAEPTSPPALDAYGQLPEIDHVTLSADGSHAAMIANNSKGSFLVDLDLAKQTTTAVPLDKIKPRNILWLDDHHVVLVKSSRVPPNVLFSHWSEVYAVNIIDTVKGSSVQLFEGMDGYNPIVLGNIGIIKKNGQYRLTASNVDISNEGQINLFSFSTTNSSSEIVDSAPINGQDWVLDGSGKPMARTLYDFDRHIWLLQSPGGGWHTVYSLAANIDLPDIEGLGRDGKSILLYTRDGDQKAQYHEVSPDGSLGPVLDTQCTYCDPLFDRNDRRLIGFSDSGDWTTYHYFDGDRQALIAKANAALPGYRIVIADQAENPEKMVVYGESDQDPGSYYFIDFTNGQSQSIGTTYADIPPEWVAHKQAITYKAADGVELHGYLTYPPGRTPAKLPLIVLPHGGPEARDDMGFDWEAQAFASRGYAVLQVNFRGSGGYGQAFVEAGYNEFGRKMQTDLSDGIRYLAALGTVDPSRVCIVGASYGGYAAMAGAALDAGVYRCAAAYAGISDVGAFINYRASVTESDISKSVLYWKRFIGPENVWPAISPAAHAAEVKIPLLLIHGREDTVVPIEQSRMMQRAMLAAGKPVELVELKGEDHYLSRAGTRQEMLATVVDFLLKNNPPD